MGRKVLAFTDADEQRRALFGIVIQRHEGSPFGEEFVSQFSAQHFDSDETFFVFYAELVGKSRPFRAVDLFIRGEPPVSGELVGKRLGR